MLFHQILAEAKLEKEIDAYFDKGLAHDRAVLVRAFDYGHLQLREALPKVGGGKLARCSASHHQNIARHLHTCFNPANALISITT
jgi:hypothetical protein